MGIYDTKENKDRLENANKDLNKKCDKILINKLGKAVCKIGVKVTQKTTNSASTSIFKHQEEINEADDLIKNGSETIGIKYGDETQPTTRPATVPATQTHEEPSRLELNKYEQQEFRRYCDHYKLKFNSNTQIYFQKHLETRKFEYLKIHDKSRDWELEFKNFIKTPPKSQVLEYQPQKLSLNIDENRVVLGLFSDKKCFENFKSELESLKATFFNKHDIAGWNKFFLHETMKLANKQSINSQNNDFSNDQCHNFDDNDRLGL